jgi:hypothetical protein
MLVITSRAFRDSQKKYLDLAQKDRVIIKRKNDFVELVHRGNIIPNNPSPSNDPWFNNPKNIEALNRSIEQAKNGQTITLTEAMQKELFSI